MAVIGQIRKRSGLVIAVIGVSLLAFVLTDALNSNSALFSNREMVVGEMGGKKIQYAEFDQKSKAMEENARRQFGELSPELQDMVRDQIWESYVKELILEKEYEKMHIKVSPEELTWVEFKNPIPNQRLVSFFTDPQTGLIMQQFVNPATGQLDLSKVAGYRKQIEPDSDAEKQWLEYVDGAIMEEIANKKYFNYVRKGNFVTTLEAKEEFMAANSSVKAQAVTLNYSSILDSTIKVTEAEMKEYLQKHPEEFKQEASRHLEYVVFDISASTEDSIAALTWANDKATAFTTTKNDSLFVVNNGGIYDTAFKPHGAFPDEVEDSLFNATKGAVVGPIFKDGSYTLYKLLDSKEDTMVYMRASHILLRPNGVNKSDTADAQKKAAELLAEIRKGSKNFKDAVKESSLDPATNQKGGDIGWFEKNTIQLPKSLVDAIARTGKGDYTIVTSGQGVHIVYVTHNKSSRTIKVGAVRKVVEPGKNTFTEIGAKANEFAGSVSNEQQFNEMIDKMGLTKRFAPTVRERDRELAGIKDARKVVMWAFDEERKAGDISEPFDAASNTKLVVARLVTIREKGTAKVEDAKEKLEEAVRKQKKAEQLKKQFDEAMKGATTIQQVATNLKTSPIDIPFQTFNSTSVAGIGADARLLGYLFGTELKKMSQPIKGENGVYVIFVESKEEPKADKLDDVKQRLTAQVGTSADVSATDALKKAADIEDFRYKFY